MTAPPLEDRSDHGLGIVGLRDLPVDLFPAHGLRVLREFEQAERPQVIQKRAAAHEMPSRRAGSAEFPPLLPGFRAHGGAHLRHEHGMREADRRAPEDLGVGDPATVQEVDQVGEV